MAVPPGAKGSLYEGALRIPFTARCASKVNAGRTVDHLGDFPNIEELEAFAAQRPILLNSLKKFAEGVQ